jgi:hypothetical protein
LAARRAGALQDDGDPDACGGDAKRPLVGEQTTIINRMKATLTRLGIGKFNPKLKKALERLEQRMDQQLCLPDASTTPSVATKFGTSGEVSERRNYAGGQRFTLRIFPNRIA